MNSFGQILRSSSIIGGASVINIGAGIAKQKAVALILGPSGVGLIGLYQNMIAVGTGIASMSVGTSTTRQLATAVSTRKAATVACIRKAVLWLTALQVSIGVALFWLLRGWIAESVLRDVDLASTIGWLSIAVGLGIVAAAQTGILLGFRRIGDTARITVASALVSAIVGVALLYWLRSAAVAVFVILPSACAAIIGVLYVRRLPKPLKINARLGDMIGQWRTLASLGLALTVGGSAIIVGQFLLRMIIYRQLGDVALGLFQAASMLSITYIGFVLQAMGADYAPRLAMVIEDREAANVLVNEQTEVALLLAAPFLLVALGAAPWLLQLFYSSAFVEASGIFRWHVLGDLLKLASWPLGYILVARGDGRTYILTETGATLILLALAWLAIPYFGIVATGIAYFGMYALYLPTLYWIARWRTGFRWNAEAKRILVVLAVACTFVAIMPTLGEGLAFGASALLATGAALFTHRRLRSFVPDALGRG